MTLRCLPDEEPWHPAQGSVLAYELDAGAHKLRVREERTRSGACEDRTLAAGEVIAPPNWFTIRAFDSRGGPLSVVIAEDGTLYVGEVGMNFKCPCSPGT